MSAMPLRWRCHCISSSPSPAQPLSNQRVARPDSPRPLCGGKRLSIVRQKDIRADIAALLSACRPTTVVRAIPLRAVNPVNGASIRPFAHIRIKIFKRLHPSVADGNSSTAIALEVRVSGVEASLLHAVPASVCSSAIHLVGSLQQYAPARPNRPAGQSVTTDGFCISAVADTHPSDFPAHWLVGHMQRCEPPIANAGSVKELCHFFTSKLLTVKGAWQSAVRQFFGSYPSQAVWILPRGAT